VMLCWLGR